MRKYKFLLLLIGIVFLAILLRFYKLGEIPLGLNTDETAIGYNAYSILTTGKDEHGVSLPLYFKSFGDHKLPVYIYGTAGAISLFGMSAFSVRFLSAFAGVISVLAVYFLILQLSKRKDFALLAAFLLAINPWHIFFSRVGFEVNVAITLLTVGVLIFFLALEKNKFSYVSFLGSLFVFLLSLYCYNVTRILSPLMFFTLLVVYRNSLKHINVKFLAFIIGLFFVGLLPFLMNLSGGAGLEGQKAVLIIGGEQFAKNIEFRSYIFPLPGVIEKLFFNAWVLIAWQYISNIISFFSVDYFFIHGANHPINGLGNSGMFHLIEVVLIPIGIVMGIKDRVKYLYPFYLWTIVVILLGSITREVPHPTRTYGVVIPFVIFSAYGFYSILTFIAKKHKLVTYGWLILFTGMLTYSLVFYLSSYYLYFPTKHAKPWRSEDKVLSEYLAGISGKYDKIIIDEHAGYSYTSFLFYGKYPPAKYVNNTTYIPNGLLLTLGKVNNIEFRKINWVEDLKTPKTLFVTLDNKPDGKDPIKTFYFPTIPIVLFYDNKFDQFPVQDVAYRVYES